ncbi:MAG: polysaccharide biosynthesis C-terminal domain-containing protein, partial [Cytophagales bacterium]|nr:polysaccharide biosynthesis C-terminal domain-containing protein [Cytophaga sp.]
EFIWIWTFAFILPTILMIVAAYRLGNFSLKPDFSVFTSAFRHQFISYSGITVLTGFSSMIIMYIDKIMLNHYCGLEETGIYNTASFFGSIMGMSLIAMNKAAVPVIVNAFNNKEHTTIAIIYRKSCMIQLIIGGLIFGGILINLDAFFELIPEGYEAGKWVIIILGLGKLFDLVTGLNGTILNLSAYYKYDSVMIATLIVLTIAANIVFIPALGLIGAAIAAMLSTLYFNVARTLIVWKKLGMQPFERNTFKVFMIAVAIIIPAYIIPHLHGSIWNNLLDMTIRSAIFSLTYVYVMYTIKVSSELNEVIDRVLGYIKIK